MGAQKASKTVKLTNRKSNILEVKIMKLDHIDTKVLC